MLHVYARGLCSVRRYSRVPRDCQSGQWGRSDISVGESSNNQFGGKEEMAVDDKEQGEDNVSAINIDKLMLELSLMATLDRPLSREYKQYQ